MTSEVSIWSGLLVTISLVQNQKVLDSKMEVRGQEKKGCFIWIKIRKNTTQKLLILFCHCYNLPL